MTESPVSARRQVRARRRGVIRTKVHLVNRSSNLCLDARGGATNGTPIQQWTCDWISNENWSFGITNNLLSSGVSNTFSHCVATPGVQDGLAMELRFCDGDPAQLWNRPNGGDCWRAGRRQSHRYRSPGRQLTPAAYHS